MEDILKQIMGNPYSGFLAWFIGIIGSLITIYIFVFQKNEIIIKEKELTIRYDARGICADCDSVISSSSLSCNKCGSSKPFESDTLIEKITRELNFNFLMFNRYVEYKNKDILKLITTYVYFFIPIIIMLIFIGYIGQQWDNIIVNFIMAIVGLLVLGYFYFMPYLIHDEYNIGDFKFSKSSEEKLNILNTKMNYTINSIEDKKTLKKLSIEIDEILKNIQLFPNIQIIKKIIFWLYIICITLVVYMSWELLGNSFHYLTLHSPQEKYFITIFYLGLAYLSTLSVIRFIWINFFYFMNVKTFGKRHLEDYKYLLNKKLKD